MRYQQNFAIIMTVVLTLGMARVAWGLAGEITSPALACPVATNGDADPVVVRINHALKESTKSFAHGHFINAHTVLAFGGDTRELNAMLERLAKIDGVEISVRFSGNVKDSQPTQLALRVATDTPRDSAWSIDHSAWNDPHLLTITINLDAPSIDREALVIPNIVGKSSD